MVRVCGSDGQYGSCFSQCTGTGGVSAAGAGGSGPIGGGGAPAGAGGTSVAGAGGTSVGGAGAGGASVGGSDGGLTMPIPPVAVQAVDKLFLGDTDWQGNPTSSAWTLYGFDLDGMVSTTQSKTHCKPVQGAKPSDVLTDAPSGVDNSFGKNILPILLGLDSTVADQVNMSITGGTGTITFGVDGLPASGDGVDLQAWMVSVVGQSMSGVIIAPTPQQWADGSYLWSAVASDVTQTTPFVAASQYPKSSLTGFLLTSSITSHGTITLPVFGAPFVLPLRNVRFTAQLSKDEKTSKTLIGAVMPTTEVLVAFKQVAGKLSPSLCSGSALQGILAQVAQASDILQDGTQDPTKSCDGISIGLGATTTGAKIGAVFTPPVATPACPLARLRPAAMIDISPPSPIPLR